MILKSSQKNSPKNNIMFSIEELDRNSGEMINPTMPKTLIKASEKGKSYCEICENCGAFIVGGVVYHFTTTDQKSGAAIATFSGLGWKACCNFIKNAPAGECCPKCTHGILKKYNLISIEEEKKKNN